MGDVVEVFSLDGGKQSVMFECPGCGYNHCVTVGHKNACGAQWTFNGDKQRPTLQPSILSRTGPWPDNHKTKPGKTDVCHSFVRDGQIQFLDDCTHALRGQTVPLRPIQLNESA
jgi:hypothetical protein